MTAAEAKAKADKSFNCRDDAGYKVVIERISAVAAKGEYLCYYTALSGKVQALLKADGYKVEYFHDPRPGESCYKIDWN